MLGLNIILDNFKSTEITQSTTEAGRVPQKSTFGLLESVFEYEDVYLYSESL